MSRGFTIIELIVVLTIIGLVSAVVLGGARTGQRDLLLNRAAQAVAQDIRLAMEYTLKTRPYTGAGCTTHSGYGIYFAEDATSYVIYAECSEIASGEPTRRGFVPASACPAEANCPWPPTGPAAAYDRTVQVIDLENPVFISAISTNIGGTARVSSLSFPPHPRIIICEDAADVCSGPHQAATSSIMIALQNNPAKTRTITITNKGVIEVE